jgi:hypothetical protein
MSYSRLFLILAGGVLLLLLASYVPAIVSPLPPDPVRLTRSLEIGIGRVHTFLSVLGLFLLWVFVFLQDLQKTNRRDRKIRIGGAFVITALLVMVVNVLVNPRGLYPVHLVEARVEDSRKIKVDLYRTTARDQTIIILGSSRSYSFSPEYIRNTLHESAFNFSVFNGRVVDYTIISNYVFDQARVKPELLIVEVNPFASFDPEISLSNTSSAFLPYMDPAWQLDYFRIRAKGLVSVEHFSDAIYTFFYRLKFPESPLPWLDWMVFADGGATRPGNPYFRETLNFMNYSAEPECPMADLQMQSLYFERLVQTARANGVGVIFVVTPWQPGYYRSVLSDSESYAQCMDEYDAIFSRLQSQYDSVYYRNYSDLTVIGGDATELGFYDHQHVTTLNANHVIDALAETINQVVEGTP